MRLRSGVEGDRGNHLSETCVPELDEESHGLAIGSDIRVVKVAPRDKSVGNRRSRQSFGRSSFYGNAFDSIRILVNEVGPLRVSGTLGAGIILSSRKLLQVRAVCVCPPDVGSGSASFSDQSEEQEPPVWAGGDGINRSNGRERRLVTSIRGDAHEAVVFRKIESVISSPAEIQGPLLLLRHGGCGRGCSRSGD